MGNPGGPGGSWSDRIWSPGNLVSEKHENVLPPPTLSIIQVRFERYFLPILVHLAHFLKFVDCVNLN